MTSNTTLDFDQTWYLDSGATRHMTPHRHWFTNYTPIAKPLSVSLADDSTQVAVGVGTIQFKLPSGSLTSVSNVLHVPKISKNLISVSQATESGQGSIEFHPQYCILRGKDSLGLSIQIKCPQVGSLYPIGVGLSSNFPSFS
jgi:hypothetical protein